MQDLALSYFNGLSPKEKKKLMKEIVSMLSLEERKELAKILLKKL